jgi:hypothetical protein
MKIGWNETRHQGDNLTPATQDYSVGNKQIFQAWSTQVALCARLRPRSHLLRDYASEASVEGFHSVGYYSVLVGLGDGPLHDLGADLANSWSAHRTNGLLFNRFLDTPSLHRPAIDFKTMQNFVTAGAEATLRLRGEQNHKCF